MVIVQMEGDLSKIARSSFSASGDIGNTTGSSFAFSAFETMVLPSAMEVAPWWMHSY
jgi:hypothetical protein